MVDVELARRRVGRDLGQLDLLAGERREGAAHDHDEAERSGVDDARLGEDLELLRAAANRLLAGEQRRREHLGDQRVLLLVAGVLVQRAPRLESARRSATALAMSWITVSIVPSAGSRIEA